MTTTNDTKTVQAPTNEDLIKELKAARRAMTQMMNRLGLYDEGRDIAKRAIKRATKVLESAKTANPTPENE